MRNIEVRWSAAPEDDDNFFGAIVKDWLTDLPPWAEIASNAETAVEKLAEYYFESEAEWDEAFGSDATMAGIIIEVHGPPHLAGRYFVDLERVVKARVTRKEPTTMSQEGML